MSVESKTTITNVLVIVAAILFTILMLLFMFTSPPQKTPDNPFGYLTPDEIKKGQAICHGLNEEAGYLQKDSEHKKVVYCLHQVMPPPQSKK